MTQAIENGNNEPGLFDQSIVYYGSAHGPKTTRLADLADRIGEKSLVCVPGGISLGSDVGPSSIVHLIPLEANFPYAIRSSALNEDSGTGLGKTNFVLPSGENDSNRRLLERACYEVINSATSTGLLGMGVLIQPVVSDRYWDAFAPALSGVLTKFNGKPLLRIAVGLGSKVVSGGEAITIDPMEFDRYYLNQRIRDLERADILVNTISMDLEIRRVLIFEALRSSAIRNLPKVKQLIEAWQTYTKGSEYWEFAIADSLDVPAVVQTHPVEESKSVFREFEKSSGIVIAEGTDTVNYGRRTGDRIYVLRPGTYVSQQDLALLHRLNSEAGGYCLIVPDYLLSTAFGSETNLQYSHFSNAGVLVELQNKCKIDISTGFSISIDHTGGKGGTHFAGLCQRNDILFLGAEVNPFAEILGSPTGTIGKGIDFYHIPWKAENCLAGGRLEITGAQKTWEYTSAQLEEWADTCYKLANELDDNPELPGGGFYEVLNLILADMKNGSSHIKLFSWTPNEQLGDTIEIMVQRINAVLESITLTKQSDDYEQELVYSEVLGIPENEIKFPLRDYLEAYKEYLLKLVT